MAFGKHRKDGAERAGSSYYEGNHRGKDADGMERKRKLDELPVYDGKRMSNANAVCKHESTLSLAGRRICNSGCGADLGEA